MSHIHNQNYEDAIAHLVDDSIVTDSQAVKFFFSGKLLYSARTGVAGKTIDLRLDPNRNRR